VEGNGPGVSYALLSALGRTQSATLSQEIADAEALNLKTWVPTFKDFYVEIKPSRISGRHFNFGEQPVQF
jgi:hypothetical protein